MRKRLVAPLLATVALAGCGQSGGLDLGGGGQSGAVAAGFPVVATKNTTRVTGSDPVTDAAAVAVAVFPSTGAGSRPQIVALADRRDWHAALAASVLISPPLRAPLLLTNGSDLPAVTDAALRRLKPTQILAVGSAAKPSGFKTTALNGRNPFAVAASVAAHVVAARRGSSKRVLVVSADAPQYAMSAAAWAAKSGDPILFVRRDSVPPETREAIARLHRPRIYVLGPGTVITKATARRLLPLGRVKRIAGPDPAATSVAFARYSDRDFGWGVVNPGHGIVFANDADPLAAAAGAGLSSSGTYGPLLVLERPDSLPAPVANFLLTIQPGYIRDPAKGVYNHGWLIGDERSISLGLQASIDALLEIAPVSGTGQ